MRRHRPIWAALAALAIVALAACRLPPSWPDAAEAAAGGGVLVHEARSPFSLIRIRDQGSRRTLLFVRDTGEEVVETTLDLRAPHRLELPYSRVMLLGLVYRPDASAVLLGGLGGGALVRFLDHYFHDVRVDAVEIDPVVVQLARDFFGAGPGPRTRVFTEDVAEYVGRTPDRYEVALMDAFLTPGAGTDPTGVPLRLKTVAFLRSLHARLTEDGVAVFNLHRSAHTADDLAVIREVFARGAVFDVPGTGNLIVVGAAGSRVPDDRELRERGRQLDRRADYGFSFERLLALRTERW